MRGPRPEREAPSRQRRYWTAMRPNAKPRIHGTTRTEPLTLLSKAPDRSGWRGAPGRSKEPIVRAQQAGACTIVAVTGRMPIIHPPHPRPV